MELKSQLEVDTTRAKLKLLQERFEASQKEPDADAYYMQLSRRSLRRMMNQMTEEILRYEAREREKAKATLTAAPSAPS